MVDLLGAYLQDIRSIGAELFFANETRLACVLVGIDIENRFFLIRRENRSEVDRVLFTQVRYIAMASTLSSEGRRTLLNTVSRDALKPSDRTVIVFSDGGQLSLGASHIKQDTDGLHMYQFPDEDRYLRLFVPAIVLERVATSKEVGKSEVAMFEWARPVITNRLELERYLALLELSATLHKIAPRYRLAELMLHERVVTTDQVQKALDAHSRHKNKRIGEILVELGAISEDELYVSLSRQLRVPFVRLRNYDFASEAESLIGAEVARKMGAVPLMVFKGSIIAATIDPLDASVLDRLRFVCDRPVVAVLATRADVAWALEKIFPGAGFSDSLRQLAAGHSEASVVESPSLDASLQASDEPLVRLVNDLLAEAIRRRVSDIHLRPGEKQIDLVYRIDGSLVLANGFPMNLHPAIVGRIKIMGNMDIAEHRRPQDGQIRFRVGESTYDLRVSILPTVTGESIVIRVLASKASLKPVDQLGFSERDLDAVREMLDKSFGLFLVTGPTGSGKSTTLYSCLRELRSKNLNIITVEDPVEFRIDGIEQVQARTDIGFTFAVALRQILRHDPDAILIGEIRDKETAEIAVKSALTGHIVLSTLHTNNAVGAISRLRDIGVVPYLLSSTLLGVQAQRLVRTNCLNCMDAEQVDAAMRRIMGVSEDELFMKGTGCDECSGTGYRGRTSVYELLRVTPALQEKITGGCKDDELLKQALDDGMVPLTRNALELARNYKTSLAEAYRVRLD